MSFANSFCVPFLIDSSLSPSPSIWASKLFQKNTHLGIDTHTRLGVYCAPFVKLGAYSLHQTDAPVKSKEVVVDVEEFLKERIREAEEVRLREERATKWQERLGLFCVIALTVFVWFVLPFLEATR